MAPRADPRAEQKILRLPTRVPIIPRARERRPIARGICSAPRADPSAKIAIAFARRPRDTSDTERDPDARSRPAMHPRGCDACHLPRLKGAAWGWRRGGSSPSGAAEARWGVGHEHRERAPTHPTPDNPVERVGCVRAHLASTLPKSERRPDNHQAASDLWSERSAERHLHYVGGRELARPPSSGAQGGLRLPPLVRSTT